ncbi:MAG TPA: sigma-54 dependent transcriptional regulator [bacterium]
MNVHPPSAEAPLGQALPGKPSVLLIDADAHIRKLLQFHLKRSGCVVLQAASGEDALKVVAEQGPVDLALLDLRLPGMPVQELLRGLSQGGKVGNIIAMAPPNGNLADAIAAMREGAFDVVNKTASFDQVHTAIRNALNQSGLKQEVQHLKQQIEEMERPFAEVIGRSEAIAQVLKLARKVRDSDITVLITGESGSGKEVIARAIHTGGTLRNRPFIAINCAAIPEALLESELFGHERGAFTGATARRIGKFSEAQDGTIFLDEVGELSAALQAKLLRVLQTKEIQPIGGQPMRVNVRIVSATNQDLMKMVQAGQFRLDLYYRLAVFPLQMPPLRARRDDIPLLVKHFLDRFSAQEKKGALTIPKELMDRLIAYNWLGNVRELENMIYRAVVLTEGKSLGLEDFPFLTLPVDLPPPVEARSASPARAAAVAEPAAPTQVMTLEETEHRAIVQALRECRGNMSQAAVRLKIGRATLYRKVKRYGIETAEG